MACASANRVAGLATSMPRVPATPARSASAAPVPAASAVTPPAVRLARSQPAASRTRQALTGRMLRMAVLTVGQRGLYPVAPVHVVTRRRPCRGGVTPLHPGRCRSPHAVLPPPPGLHLPWPHYTEQTRA